jgi:aspartyl-tRNA synthetase
MAYEDGRGVMARVEILIKSIYKYFSTKPVGFLENPLPEYPFFRMPYEEAMSNHGSDKPDLRIGGLVSYSIMSEVYDWPLQIHRIDKVVPDELRSMLTSIQEPIIEACKLRFDCHPEQVRAFIARFMDSPDAEPFTSNIDGAPGFCVYDSRKPIEGLQTLGFEGAEKLKALYSELPRPGYQNKELHKINCAFEDGDLLVIQARQNLPHSGGSTILGKLRLAIHKAAVAEGLISPNSDHHYLWVTEFPMFTPNNGIDPGQGGTSGFSATHHPFTAPLTLEDVDLLLTDPLKAKADHYDLVVNGVEIGGGSRRIHNAEMQKFVMRDIIKVWTLTPSDFHPYWLSQMSEERMNDFSHLFEALSSGCPPHAGFAIGFDRLIAVMTGVESVKDVIFFPKSSKGEDMMVKSPAPMTNAELSRYHLHLKSSVEAEGQEKEEQSSEEKVEEMKSEPPFQG